MSITFNDDEDVAPFLPAARAIVAYEDTIPRATWIMNRLLLEGHINATEWSTLTAAMKKPHGLLGYLRAWWAA